MMVLMAATSSGGQLRPRKVCCLLARSLFHLSYGQPRRAATTTSHRHGGGQQARLDMDIDQLDMEIARLQELKNTKLSLLKTRPRTPPAESSVHASSVSQRLASIPPASEPDVPDPVQRASLLGAFEPDCSSSCRRPERVERISDCRLPRQQGDATATAAEKPTLGTGNNNNNNNNNNGKDAIGRMETAENIGVSSGGENAAGENSAMRVENLAMGVDNKDVAFVWTEMAENVETLNESSSNVSASKVVEELSDSAECADRLSVAARQGGISPRCIENMNCDGSSEGEMALGEKSTRVKNKDKDKDKNEDVFVWTETVENIGALNESFKLLNIVKSDADADANAKNVLKKIVDAEEKVRQVASEATAGNGPQKAKALEDSLPNNAVASVNECLLTFDDHTDADLIAKGIRMDHPWPEWREFLKDMNKKGYMKSIGEPDYTGEPMLSMSAVVRESGNLLGRERDDIFRFLSKPHIKVLAKFGCPSTSRKVVNAGKRLRKHCSVAEGDVCQHCNLKRSCTRAFSDSSPHVATGTLDIVRYVIPFALNRYPDVESHTTYPKEVEAAACGLLKEFVKYTARARDPDIPKAKVVSIPRSIKQSVDENGDKKETCMEERSTQKAYDDSRDWVCSSCSFVNFARNRVCKNCSAFRPVKKRLLSDWDCLKCGYTNFFRNSACYECKTIRPTMLEWQGGERRPINKTNKMADRNETSNPTQPAKHQTHARHGQGQSQSHDQGQSQRHGQIRSQGQRQGQNLSQGQGEEWEESCESSEEGFWHEKSDAEMNSDSRNDVEEEDGSDLSDENRAYSGRDLKRGKGPSIGQKIDDGKRSRFYLGRMNSSKN